MIPKSRNCQTLWIHRTNHNSIITSIPWRTDGWYLRYDASWPVVHRDQSPATSQWTDSLLIPSSYNLHYAMLHAVQEHPCAARSLLGWRHVFTAPYQLQRLYLYQCRPFAVHKQQNGSTDHQSQVNWYRSYCLLHVSVFLKIHNQVMKKYKTRILIQTIRIILSQAAEYSTLEKLELH